MARTARDWGELWLAIEAQCDCAYDLPAAHRAIYAAHRMLIVQLTLDHLVTTGSFGEIASDDPWNGATLEWSIPLPPPPLQLRADSDNEDPAPAHRRAN